MVRHHTASLQCIDLSNPDINQLVDLVNKACSDYGIFYLINHGISEEFMGETFAQMKKFFGMPFNEKMKFAANYTGHTPRGYEAPKQKDYVERFFSGVPEDDSNVWPPNDILPGWKGTIQKYYRETFNVGIAVMRIIALALEINFDFFTQSELLGKDTDSLGVILHYGDRKTVSAKEKLGVIAHNDATFITLLATDDVWGLQICRDRNAKPQFWEDVAPMKGAFIVISGLALNKLTNEAFRSVWHRALYCQERYCIGVFLAPSFDWVVDWKSEKNPPNPQMKYADLVRSLGQTESPEELRDNQIQ